MAGSKTKNLKRVDLKYFEGVNAQVGNNLSKKTELSHGENVRSDKIGTVEKRKGTVDIGDDISATESYGLFYFNNSTGANTGLYRIVTT